MTVNTRPRQRCAIPCSPSSALVVDVASVGVDGVAGDAVGLLRSREANGVTSPDATAVPAGRPCAPGNAVNSAAPMAYRTTEIWVPAGNGESQQAGQAKVKDSQKLLIGVPGKANVPVPGSGD